MDINSSKVRCQSRLALHQCLAIVLRKEGCQGDPGDFWMYENGYPLFQGLLSANSLCWWNTSLNGASKSLEYKGYVNPGALLVGSEPCSLDVLRNAWARRVLQPPQGYQIVALEEIEGCYVKPVTQTQWTPLTEAVCAVVLRLSSQGKPAGIETIREALYMVFPHVSPPSEQLLYDTLTQLTTEKKLYHTSSGYFIVTPERRRSRSLSRNYHKRNEDISDLNQGRSLLMSPEEALVMVHGDMTTIRDGAFTHQNIQTNLADVISGGNASDKVLYARQGKQWTSFPSSKNPDQRSSFRLWSSNRRIRRSASTRTISKNYLDTSSSTDGPHSDTSPSPKKASLFSRIFRKSKRSQCQIHTYSAQFPPSEWFNSKAVHLHSVGTQTLFEKDTVLPYDKYETNIPRSASLPRRHRRCLSGDLTYVSSYSASRENSPVSKTIGNTLTLPKNSKLNKHPTKSRESSRKTSRSSLHKAPTNQEDKDKLSVNDKISLQNVKSTINGNSNSVSSSHDSVRDLNTCDNNFVSNEPNAISESIKSLSQVDNSGPSSIESHKSSRTGSSLTSGPSSIESHKTVIQNNPPLGYKSPIKHALKRDKSKPIKPVITTSTIPQSNSFILQVTTSQGNPNVTSKSNTKTTATINNGTGSNTKIYVQNSPVRSVITFENGQNVDSNPNLVIINGTDAMKENESEVITTKNTNQVKESTTSLNNSKDLGNTDNSVNNDIQTETMNNIRKLSLQLPAKESLSYHNLIKNVSSKYSSNSNPDSPIANSLRDFTKNSIYCSSPPSPTKTADAVSSSGNVFIQNGSDSKIYQENSFSGIDSQKVEKNLLGSEPNIYCKDKTLTKNGSIEQYPSLNDLTFNFTSLAAQKILKGVSINSVDTLVELNMAVTNEKQNNCDIVHTDFGMF